MIRDPGDLNELAIDYRIYAFESRQQFDEKQIEKAWLDGVEWAMNLCRKNGDAQKEALEFYANPEIYKPHPHGPAFGDRDLSYVAKAALSNK